ncbi:MAG: DUF5667 domain-containing protein [bacterium]
MDEVLLDKIQFYGKKWGARLSLALAVILMVPTVAIMASWNSLPGDKMYPTKRYLESVALKLVGNNFSAKASLQIQFVDQRFNEAETLLSESSSSGLTDLVQQIKVSKTEIIAAKTKVGSKDIAVAEQKSQKLVTQLKEYNQKLETTQQATPNTVAPIVSPTSAFTPKSVATPQPTVVASPHVSPAPVASAVVTPVVTQNITTVEQVQVEISRAIVELEGDTTGDNHNNDNSGDQNNGNNKDRQPNSRSRDN